MIIRKLDLAPLYFFGVYIIMTLVLSFFGPIEYNDYDKLSVGIYMLSFLMLFGIGYLSGCVVSKKKELGHAIILNNGERWNLKITRCCIVLFFMTQIVLIIMSLLSGKLNLIPSNLGSAYVDTYKGYVRGTGNFNFVFLLTTLTYPLFITTITLGTYFYRKLTLCYRAMVIFSYVSVFFLETVGHGKQLQLGVMVLIFLLISSLKTNLSTQHNRRKTLLYLIGMGLIGFSALLMILSLRYDAIGIDSRNIADKLHPLMKIDTDSFVFVLLGEKLGLSVTFFISYLSQGYYGLSLAFQQPFVWTYMVGNSYSLTLLLNKFIGIPVNIQDSYPYRVAMDTTWGASKWSTAFVWFAGDFTFVGTLFVFGLVAYFYAKLWQEAYYDKYPSSIILFCFLTYGLLMIPANNQLLLSPGNCLTLILVLLARWYVSFSRFLSVRNHRLAV